MTNREIDDLVAEKVMGYKAVELKRGSILGGPAVDLIPGMFHIKDSLGKFTAELCNVAEYEPNTGNRIPNYPWYDWKTCPYYSTDIAAAWQVVEKVSDDLCAEFTIEKSNFMGFYQSFIEWSTGAGYDSKEHVVNIEEKTAPKAICLAALKAVGHEVNDET